jgi:hypothetical protein
MTFVELVPKSTPTMIVRSERVRVELGTTGICSVVASTGRRIPYFSVSVSEDPGCNLFLK